MNRNLFGSVRGVPADTTNNAGGLAYSMPPKEALAQLACTGFFADTFYVAAETQLDQIIEMAKQCDDAFVAQVARYARFAGYMKDTPAVLLAYLFGKRSDALTPAIFFEVIDNVKMLSNFVQGVRSGKFCRRNLGSRGSWLVGEWLARRDADYLWKQSIAKDPSLADVIWLSRTKPRDAAREALHQLILGKPLKEGQEALLPDLVKATLAFRKDPTTAPLPDVPFNMIDSLPLKPEHWRQLFERGGWMFTRMNLVTALRHGVFKDEAMVKLVADRLSDREQVIKARQFPYQLLLAYKMASEQEEMPTSIRSALHRAMEAATLNVPALPGRLIVAVDCSGSMGSPATGARGEATSKATYADIAALFAATLLRKNPQQTKVMTFSQNASYVAVDPEDTIMTTAQKLAKAGGGTDTSAPLRKLAHEQTPFDVFVLISDNDTNYGAGTGSNHAWEKCKKHNPGARQVRINISPNATDQLPKRDDTLRVGGFSDAVFTAMAAWLEKKDWTASVSSFGR
jgi:60 kDa SS-A/Ro ribonucleoprotein